MRIVIATPLYPPEIGGPATYASLLFDGLPAKGIDVELVKFSDVRHLPKIIRHYVYYHRVLKAARNADAVVALDPVSVGLPAMKAAQSAGRPFVVKIVGDYAWEQGQQRFGVSQGLDKFIEAKQESFFVRRLQAIQTRVAAAATRVVVPSEYLKNVVTAWGIPNNKIQVIYNSVHLDVPGAVPDNVAKLPKPLVVTVGRLVPWKNIDGLIDVIDRLHTKQTSAFLVVIGDGPEREKLESYAREKLGNFCLFTGALSHSQTLAIMKEASVVALNSSYEGLSHVLIEAQMLGVPIVATHVGGNSEVIEDGRSGILVPLGDTSAFSDALMDVILDGNIRPRLIAGAVESAKRFSTETMLSSTATMLQNT